MDNNLDAKKTRLNPYNAPPSQMKQERGRDKLPPSPTEASKNQITRPARETTPSVAGYPTVPGTMDQGMPDRAGRAAGYPTTPGTMGQGMPDRAGRTAGYPTAPGAMDQSMPGRAARTEGYPTGMPGMPTGMPGMVTGTPLPGFPASIPGVGLPTPGTPATGFPSMQTMPGMPTGIPAGGATGVTPLTPFNQTMPITLESTLYINGFLRSFIGRKVTVEFLIGTNTFTDRTGTLLAVGANYIVINEVEADDILICDFFSIKFVKVYY